ncbi:MAG TPA: AAA family ATPase [Glaciihabitans sp.]|jgi:adenylate kinase family enzyme|nr:AAA family ATPase [Glaciihabitans sp.]
MLCASDRLSPAPRRILIAGVTGVGKSVLAQRIEASTAIPYSELDRLYHGPNWTQRTTFLADVSELANNDAWVTEWQYRSARVILEPAADTLVWLDFPLPIVLLRLIRRTVWRRLTHHTLWAGNTEPPLWHFVSGKDNVLRWAIRSHSSYRTTIPALAAANPQLRVVQLRRPAEAQRWLTALSRSET